MHMHAIMFGGNSVIVRTIVMMIEGFGVVLIVMIVVIIMAHIQSDSMDSVTRIVVVLMSMGRSGRNETIACKGKRQAKAHEAPGKRHGFQATDELLHFAEGPTLDQKSGCENGFLAWHGSSNDSMTAR